MASQPLMDKIVALPCPAELDDLLALVREHTAEAIKQAVIKVEGVQQCRHCAAHGACALMTIVEVKE